MDRFSKYNPKATLLFFVLIIIVTITSYHPIFISISFFTAFLYKLKLDGRKAIPYLLKFILPLVIIVSLFNMLFTHYGATILFEAFDMNYTLEGLFYGFSQGLMLGAVIMWISNYSSVITSEKFLSVFGRYMPNSALLLSMVLSFIPRLKKNATEINDARLLLDSKGNKIKKSINSFSALITLTLEESIEISNSMKSRFYGSKRSVYSKYRICPKDYILIAFELVLTAVIIALKLCGYMKFTFEPVISMGELKIYSVVPFAILSLIPIIIDFAEDIKWFCLKQKI